MNLHRRSYELYLSQLWFVAPVELGVPDWRTRVVLAWHRAHGTPRGDRG